METNVSICNICSYASCQSNFIWFGTEIELESDPIWSQLSLSHTTPYPSHTRTHAPTEGHIGARVINSLVEMHVTSLGSWLEGWKTEDMQGMKAWGPSISFGRRIDRTFPGSLTHWHKCRLPTQPPKHWEIQYILLLLSALLFTSLSSCLFISFWSNGFSVLSQLNCSHFWASHIPRCKRTSSSCSFSTNPVHGLKSHKDQIYCSSANQS